MHISSKNEYFQRDLLKRDEKCFDKYYEIWEKKFLSKLSKKN